MPEELPYVQALACTNIIYLPRIHGQLVKLLINSPTSRLKQARMSVFLTNLGPHSTKTSILARCRRNFASFLKKLLSNNEPIN